MKRTIWVIGCDGEASQQLCRDIGHLENLPHRPVECLVSCVGADDEPPLAYLRRAVAVVLVIDRDALASAAFAALAGRAIAALNDRHDLCVLPWLNGVAFPELQALAEADNALAVALLQNVHVDPSAQSIDGVTADLRRYLDDVEMLRTFGLIERVSLRAKRHVGGVAGVVGVLVVAAAAPVATMILWRTPQYVPSADTMRAAVVVLWAAIFILGLRLLRCLRLLTRDWGLVEYTRRIGMDLLGTGSVGCVLALAGVRLEHQYGLLPVLTGVGFGGVIVTLVRAGRAASLRASDSARLVEAAEGRVLLPQLYREMVQYLLHPAIPLYEPAHTRVFISYCHASAWSVDLAGRLAKALKDLGAYTFLDRPALRTGLSWRRQLRWAIEHSNVFVAIIDHTAAQREWVAAEFATAFRSKALTGTPEIIVVHDESMDFSGGTVAPDSFFGELLVKPAHPMPYRMRTKLTKYNEANFEPMCRAIRWYRVSGDLGFLPNVITHFAVSVAVPLIALACHLGVPLLLLSLLVVQGQIAPEAWLNQHISFVPWLAAAATICAGFSLRAATRCFGEVRRDQYAYTPGWLELAEAAGFVAALVLCRPRLSLLETLVSVLMLFVGLGLAGVYATALRTYKSAPIEPSDQAARDAPSASPPHARPGG